MAETATGASTIFESDLYMPEMMWQKRISFGRLAASWEFYQTTGNVPENGVTAVTPEGFSGIANSTGRIPYVNLGLLSGTEMLEVYASSDGQLDIQGREMLVAESIDEGHIDILIALGATKDDPVDKQTEYVASVFKDESLKGKCLESFRQGGFGAAAGYIATEMVGLAIELNTPEDWHNFMLERIKPSLHHAFFKTQY